MHGYECCSSEGDRTMCQRFNLMYLVKQSTTLLAIRRLHVFTDQYTTGNTREDESSNDYDMTSNLRMMQFIDMIANPR